MEHIYSHVFSIEKKDRLKRNGHNAITIWLTGLSGSGKSTIANGLEKLLFDKQLQTYLLDGDNIREGICNNLGFTEEDRTENIRRIAEVSKLFNEAGMVTINSFVSPTIKIRSNAKEIIGSANFIEVFIDTPLEVCEERDVKGLYKKARKGEIKNFTGIDAPFEAPISADIIIKTKDRTIEESVQELFEFVLPKIGINE